ncbi:MAG: ABC transporter substrate-binding protein [Chloroflexi bacterium]|nr:ABC transporter substrate-binding protein [Chloroflexota bacterium]
MSVSTSRRRFVRLLVLGSGAALLTACAQPAASPTPAPAKPTEPPKPVAPAPAPAPTSPAASPAAAKPAGSPVASPAAVPSPAAPSPAAAPAVSKPGGPLQKVSVAVTTLHTWYWAMAAALNKKLMEPHGVELDVVRFQGAAQANTAMVSGSVQISMSAPDGIFPVQERDPDVKLIGSAISVNPYTLVVAPSIGSIPELKGKSIGVTNVQVGADNFALRLMLANHGLKAGEDYSFVQAGSTSERAAAILSGSIQATVQFEPQLSILTERGLKELDSASNYPALRDSEVVDLTAKKSWYTANQALAVNFARGYLASVRWLYDPANRAEAIRILAKEMQVDEAKATKAYERFVVDLKAYPKDGKVDMAKLQNSVENVRQLGGAAPSNLADRVDNSLFDAAGR